ncbi:MAG TPA: hypothetical protein VN231_05825 [Allosphingosinicella sp.]|nr:hypothetical protein [Allosphingosinicella sp.]
MGTRIGTAKQRIAMAAALEKWRRAMEAEQRGLGMSREEARAEVDRRWARMKARLDWIDAQFADMVRLHEIVGEQYARFEDEHPEIDWEDPDAPEMPETPELAELHRIEEALTALRLRDEWPAHLYWSQV